MALSRGTQANHLYYMGEPPPDEDHHAPDVVAPEFDRLVAAVGRSRGQVMALDMLQDRATAPSGGDGAAGHWTEAPMTEAQVAILARGGVVPERDLTWVQASLLIDEATGAPRGRQASRWLHENGARPEEAAAVIERATRDLRAPSADRDADAVGVRLEVLDAAARERGGQSNGEALEIDALSEWQARAARRWMRQRRLAWARNAPAADDPAAAGIATSRASLSRSPPRIGR